MKFPLNYSSGGTILVPLKGMGPKGFDPLTIGLEVQHSIQAEL